MNKEKTEYLFNKYPEIFAGKDEPITQNLMYFGFECGDGWFWLIDNLCELLSHDVKHNDEPQIKAVQVKEKYGTLRFYTQGASTRQYAMIDIIEHLSGSTCELCGRPGSLHSSNGSPYGWYKTLCEKCANSAAYFKIEEEETKNEI
jgi:hypothetical protein